MAALLAGATSAHAQELQKASTSPPAAPPPLSPVQRPATSTPPGDESTGSKPNDASAEPQIEFWGADEKDLPPEVQREVREQLKSSPPPGSGGTTPAPRRSTRTGAGENEIVVTGQRPRGSVISDVPPERTLSTLDVRAYGASDIGELLDTIRPQVSSDLGREDNDPVVLLNGKRVSSFAEIAKIPTEAIERMEVFPEELALAYGYRADQKLVNVVTFERFGAGAGELTYSVPTDGGRNTIGADASYLRIAGDTRYNFDADYDRSGLLRESDRNILPSLGPTDARQFRSLLPQAERLAFNGTISGAVLGNVSSTLNGRFQASSSRSLLGLAADGPLTRHTETGVIHLGTAHNGQVGKWLWSFTGNYDRSRTDTSTDVVGGPGTRSEAQAVNSFADAELVLSGSVLKLPAGPLFMSVSGGARARDFEGQSLSAGVERRTKLSRDSGAIQASIDVPIARRGKVNFGRLGNLSTNVNLGFERLSDAGTLSTFGYGLTWSAIPGLNLIASVTNEEGAPTVEQLGSPLIETPGIPTYDFRRRETTNLTRLLGGNPGLRPDDRRVARIAVNAQPFPKSDLSVSIDYVNTRINDPIASFPIATPAVEEALPERFTRDLDGRLLRIDSRPINFARSEQKLVRWGFNYTRPLGPVSETQKLNSRVVGGGETGLQAALPPGARIVRPEAGSAAARRVENLTSRLIFSLYHTWRIEDTVLISQSGKSLDLLDGFAISNRGGSPRHEIELQAGAFKGGLGARVSATWQSGTVVRGLSAPAGSIPGDLVFSDFGTMNVNFFVNLADRFGGAQAPSWIRGTRISIGIDNVFNGRPRVEDANGATPRSYQPAYLDPLGRSISFSLRRTF